MLCCFKTHPHTLLSLVALQAHDICNRLACLGLFPPFIFLSFFFVVFPLFILFLWFGWSVASPCAHMWQQLWSLSLSFHLCAGRTWQRFVPFGPFSFSLPLPLLLLWLFSLFSLFLLFITLLLLSQQCASVSVPLFAPLFMPPCGRHYFSSASCKLNKTHTGALTHTHETC